MSSIPQSRPLVAVATPVYNGARYLAEALASVQAQTYPNLIHVVLDNASTDDTPKVIERFKGGRVPIITHRNSVTLPLQKNWSAVVGLVPEAAKYFQVLCADDAITPESISKMVALAESDPQIELVGGIQVKNGKRAPCALPPDQNVFDGARIARSFLMKESNDLPHSFPFFRRHSEDFATDFFDENLWAMDGDACLRAIARGRFGFIHEPLFILRLHEHQLTSTIIKVNQSRLFEPLVFIERWGPRVMTGAEYKICLAQHLRVIYRFMLMWRVTGKADLYNKCADLLRQRNITPRRRDFVYSTFEWPVRLMKKHLRKHRLAIEQQGGARASAPAR